MCALFHTLGDVEPNGAQQFEAAPNIHVVMVQHTDWTLHALESQESASHGKTDGSVCSFPFFLPSAEEQV